MYLHSGALNGKCTFLYTDIFCDSLRQVVSKVLHIGLNVCRAQEVLSLLLTVSWCTYVVTSKIYFIYQFDCLYNFYDQY